MRLTIVNNKPKQINTLIRSGGRKCLFHVYRFQGIQFNQPHLFDFATFQCAKTQYSPRVLDVVASNFSSSLHSGVLVYENACIRSLGKTLGIKRYHPDLTGGYQVIL
jgi:hypothetical protein